MFSYSLIAYKTFGTKMKVLVDVMIALTQFSFSLSLVSFISASAHSIFMEVFDLKIGNFAIGCALTLILVPVAWVRNISKFSFTFLIGNTMILLTVIITSVLLFMRFSERGYTAGKNLQPINNDTYMVMVGFSVFSFEGIGVVMPIM